MVVARAGQGAAAGVGSPGSGRSTRARELVEHEPFTILSPGAALLDGDTAWARDFDALTGRKTGSVCIDGIDLLSDRLLELVSLRVDRRDRPQLIFVSGPVGDLTGRAAALAATATSAVSATGSGPPQELGVSLTTLCARMRSLRITAF